MTGRPGRLLEVGGVFLRLGCTSFGGPAAHIGYFRDAVVRRGRWLDDATYAELLALVQLLPGPASTQLAVILGIGRAGLPGGLLAWLGFTLPSALIMVAFGLMVGQLGDLASGRLLQGLKVAVVGVVAQAAVAMSRHLCPDPARQLVAGLAAVVALTVTGPAGQLLAIGIGGVIGWARLGARLEPHGASPAYGQLDRRVALTCFGLFVGLLVALPALRALTGDPLLARIDAFYRAGALVFGGGHVILPLLQAEVVQPGWVDPELFLAGYGAAQVLPGPLFTFAAYLGVVMASPLPPVASGVVCLLALFLPSALLVLGVLPFWAQWRELRGMAGVLAGVGAAVVGLLVAAMIDPIWPSAIHGPIDLALALGVFGLLVWGRLPPWLIVVCCAAGRGALSG